ncbi:MAG: tetratricopeptide repeat protein [Alphaproteobacteria bacterium]
MRIFLKISLLFFVCFAVVRLAEASEFVSKNEEKCASLHPRIKIENQFWYNDEAVLAGRAACYDLGLAYYSGTDGVVANKEKAAAFFMRASEYENYDAQYMFGLMLFDGDGGLAKDIPKAIEIIRNAGEKGSVLAQSKLAQLFSDDKFYLKNDKDALYWYLKAAQSGNLLAQYEVGNRYELGIGVDKDLKTAVKWFGEAAQKGSPEAQYRLGMMFFMGDPLPQDLKMAFNLIKASADKGYVYAQYFLGYMYEKGSGVIEDKDKALEWYKKAAAGDFDRAYIRLAELELTEYQMMLSKAYLLGEKGFKKDAAKSAYWLEKAAKNGDADAQFQLGHFYLEGFGVEKSEENAAIWFKAASLNGYEGAEDILNDILVKKDDANFYNENEQLFEMAGRGGDEAQFQLAVKYEEKFDAKTEKSLDDRDIKEALRWYKKSAEQNNLDAIFRLGKAYFSGDIIEKDEKKGLDMLKKAGEKGNYEAQKMLAKVFEKRIGSGSEKSYSYYVLKDPSYWDALYWYEKTAESKKPEDFYRLGIFYFNHLPEKKGYEENLYNAWYWLEKAKQEGVENARDPIKNISRRIGRNYRIKENKMIETFIDKLIKDSDPDLETAEKLGLRRYSREEMALSDLFYAYGVNLKCGYDKSVTIGRGFALYKNEVDAMISKLVIKTGKTKIEHIKNEAEEFASGVICDTKEAYKAKSVLLKFSDL